MKSYDDVLLRPKRSPVKSLSDVDTSTEVGGYELGVPIFSAPMDTVTEEEMAMALGSEGGCGVIHRFLSTEEQVEMVKKANLRGEASYPVGAAVGLNEFQRAKKLEDAGVDYIVADIAHAHHDQFISFVDDLNARLSSCIVAGNVATYEGAKDLSDAGADVIKVGVGPGSACSTREKTGAGVPQLSAVEECSGVDADIIADGGIRKPGDMNKALMAGADAVMMGGELADTKAAPRDGEFRGMSTKKAAEDRTDRDLKESDSYEEGEVMELDTQTTVEKVVENYKGGLKSGLSYCGAHSIEKARENSEFIEITGSTEFRNGAHGHSL